MLSVAVGADEQGPAMGNNQSLQVGAEALSGLLGGVLAAAVVKLPLTHDFLNADRGRLKWDSPADVTGRRRSGTPGPMLGWILSVAVRVSPFAAGSGSLSAPCRSAALYGILLDDQRALAFIRAMGARDLVIGGLLAVIAFQGRGAPLGWSLCLTAVVALADYVVVTADRRAVISGAPARASVLHAMGAVGLVLAGGLLLAGF